MVHKLGINIGGNWLVLPTDLTLNIDLLNPLMDTEVNISLFSYNFTIENCDENARILNFPGTVELSKDSETFLDFDATLYIDGILIYSGEITVSEVTNDTITLYFRDQLGAYADDVSLLTLRDLEFDEIFLQTLQEPIEGGYTLYQIADFMKGMALDDLIALAGCMFFPSYHALLPYSATHDVYDTYRLIINNYDTSADTFDIEPTIGGDPTHNTMVPYLFLSRIISQCFTHFGFTFSCDLFNDADFKRLVIHNSRSLSFYGNRFGGDVINEWPLIYANPVTEQTIIAPERYIPAMKIADFFTQVKKLFNTGIFFNPILAQAELLSWKMIKDADETIDWTAIVNPQPLVQVTDVDTDVVRKYDDDSENNYLQGATTDLSGDDTTTLGDVNDITTKNIITPVAQVADLPSAAGQAIDDVCLVTGLDQWYIVRDVNGSNAWAFYSYDIQQAKNGSGANDVTNAPGLLPMTVIQFMKMSLLAYTWDDWHNADKQFQGNYNLRLLFYRGLQPVTDGGGAAQQPLGTVDEFTQTGVQVGNWTMGWFGDRGLFNTHWKSFYEMLAFKPITYPVRLTVQDIINISYKKFIIIRGSKFYIKRVKLSLPNIEDSIVEMYKVPE